MNRYTLRLGFITLFPWPLCLTGSTPAANELAAPRPLIRHVAPGEDWEMREGRFYRNGEWVFIKTGKLLRAFAEAKTADKVIAEIDVMVDRLNFNNFSLNIYPDAFDADGDGRIDPARQEAYANIGRILDHCWKRGVFYSLSFETYNIGGGGTPASFFAQHPEAIAINALGEKARDHEYTVSDGKLIPSVYHPAYHAWSRTFIRNFLSGLGADRCSRSAVRRDHGGAAVSRRLPRRRQGPAAGVPGFQRGRAPGVQPVAEVAFRRVTRIAPSSPGRPMLKSGANCSATGCSMISGPGAWPSGCPKMPKRSGRSPATFISRWITTGV